MNKEEINEIIECLPKGRTRFCYFKDRYALLLLRLALDAPASKNEVRGTAFARLLDKPIVKSAIGGHGNSAINPKLLDAHWPASYERYVLTLGVWGWGNRLWTQTSRTGFNLVLQLNFSTWLAARR